MTTAALMEQEQTSWDVLTEALEGVDPQRREEQGVVPGWSTHDIAWHCGAWALHAAEAIDHIRATGSEAPEPDYDEMEASILAEGRTKTWDEALAHAALGRQRAKSAFAAFDEPTEDATTWFTDEAVEHYRDHADQIKTFFGAP